MGHGRDWVFETDYLRYVVSGTGHNLSVLDVGGGAEFCRRPGCYPFASFGTRPPGAPKSLTREGDMLHVAFNKEGAEAVIEVAEKPHYLTFELKELRGVDAEVFNLASLGVIVTEHIGKTLNTVWTPTFGVCLLSLTMNAHAECDTVHEPVAVSYTHLRAHET